MYVSDKIWQIFHYNRKSKEFDLTRYQVFPKHLLYYPETANIKNVSV